MTDVTVDVAEEIGAEGNEIRPFHATISDADLGEMRRRIKATQYEAPRSWTEKACPKLIYYHKAEKGGHFAAWEQPQIFVEELRASFRQLRK